MCFIALGLLHVVVQLINPTYTTLNTKYVFMKQTRQTLIETFSEMPFGSLSHTDQSNS